MPKKKPSPISLHPRSTVRDLAASSLLEDLTLAELIVYLRLAAARDTYPDERRMPITNAQLHRDPRTCGRALARLVRRGMIVVRVDARTHERTVEVR